jgi:hypothetical protein
MGENQLVVDGLPLGLSGLSQTRKGVVCLCLFQFVVESTTRHKDHNPPVRLDQPPDRVLPFLPDYVAPGGGSSARGVPHAALRR